MNDSGVKFIRVGGRVIPVRKKKENLKDVVKSAKMGAAVGAVAGGAAGVSIGKTVFENNMKMPSARFAKSMIGMANIKNPQAAINSATRLHKAIFGIKGVGVGLVAGFAVGATASIASKLLKNKKSNKSGV